MKLKKRIALLLCFIMLFNFIGVISTQIALAASFNEQKVLYEKFMKELYDLGYREEVGINSKETYDFLVNLGFTKEEIIKLYSDYWREQSLENSDQTIKGNNYNLFATSQPKEGDFKYVSFDFYYKPIADFLGLGADVYTLAQLGAHVSAKQLGNALINVYGMGVVAGLSLYFRYITNAHPGKVGVRGSVCYKYTYTNDYYLDWVPYPVKSTRVYY